MSEFQQIPLINIEVPESHREVDPDKVEQLAAAIDKLGLLQPITVRQVTKGAHYIKTLVTGRHRLEAVPLLGHKSILARVIVVDDIQARLMEISENLHRNELTAAARAHEIADWIRLTEAKVDASEGRCVPS